MVFGSSLSTPLLICFRQINFCSNQFNHVLLNNLWIQDMKKSLWWQILALKYIFRARSFPPRACSKSWLRKNYPCSIALRTDWKINRYHLARLVSSNRDWFAYYRHTTPIFTHSLYAYVGETIMPPGVLASGPKPWAIYLDYEVRKMRKILLHLHEGDSFWFAESIEKVQCV